MTAPITPTSGAAPGATSWAALYSSWFLGKAQSQNNLITSLVSSYSTAIPMVWARGMTIGQGEVRGFANFMANFKAAYNVAAFTFPAPTNWPASAINIQKRQAAACPATSTGGNNPAKETKPVVSQMSITALD